MTGKAPAASISIWLLAGIVLASVIAVIAYGPIPQWENYHSFADQRRIFGIPNFWNVASNLPFAMVGLAGLFTVRGGPTPGILPALRPAYLAFFLGTALVAVGSGHYHLAPSDASLVWDRLPMTIAFMAFLAILVGEQIGAGIGARLLLPLVAAGLLSVAYWVVTAQYGAGDLRPYVLVQFLPMILTPLLLLLFPSPFSRPWLLWGLVVAYVLAKLFEYFDAPIFNLAHAVSGHSLKHIAAALGTYFVLLAATRRAVCSADAQAPEPSTRTWRFQG